MSSVAARLEARAAAAASSSDSTHHVAENATVASEAHVRLTATLKEFEEGKKAITDELETVKNEAEKMNNMNDDSAVETTRSSLQSRLGDIASRLTSLRSSLHANAHILTTYDLRATKLALESLEESLATITSMVAPRKKFSFRNKKKKQDKVVTKTTADAALDSNASDASAAANIPAPAPQPAEPAEAEDHRLGFFHHRSRVLIKLDSVTGRDVVLSDLDGCVVLIPVIVSALRCYRLKRCIILIGGVSGSCLVYGAEHCIFDLVTRQLRIHAADTSFFYVATASNPIIEHSQRTFFGARHFSYPSLHEQLESCGLVKAVATPTTVEDFNWLRAQKSPNWTLLSDDDESVEQTKKQLAASGSAVSNLNTFFTTNRLELSDEQLKRLEEMVDETVGGEDAQKRMKQLINDIGLHMDDDGDKSAK